MKSSSVKRQIKERMAQMLLSIMETEAVSVRLRREFGTFGKTRATIDPVPNPYRTESTDVSVRGRRPILISGRFRSGSTLLWNIFRHMEGHTAFYEPFNERRWFDVAARGGYTDTTHRGVSDYWTEYNGLGKLRQYYREDWTRNRLFMDEHSFDHEMRCFIDRIIEEAPDRPVLQFNRADFRLPWLRYNYPDATLVHIYRSPRDQWCSTLGNIDDYPYDAGPGADFPDRFYLRVWYRDLVAQFPFLERFESSHQYYLFYLIWRLSYCFGRRYSHLSIGMEDLTGDPHALMARLLDVTESKVDLSTVDLSFVEPTESRWEEYASARWFEQIEDECDEWIDDFFGMRE